MADKKFTINKYYIIDSTIVAAITAGFVFSFIFLNQNIKNYQDTQTKIDSTLLTYQVNDQVISEFKKAGVNENTFLGALPTQDTIVNWITQTETIAKNAGVKQTLNFTNGDLTKDNIVLLQPGAGGLTPSLNVNIVVNGTYNQVLSYITMLDKSYYYTRINTVSFTAAANSSGSTGTTPTPTPVQQTASHNVSATLNVDLFVKDILAGQPAN